MLRYMLNVSHYPISTHTPLLPWFWYIHWTDISAQMQSGDAVVETEILHERPISSINIKPSIVTTKYADRQKFRWCCYGFKNLAVLTEQKKMISFIVSWGRFLKLDLKIWIVWGSTFTMESSLKISSILVWAYHRRWSLRWRLCSA